MDSELINNISTIVFLVVIGFFALISLLTAFVLIRYGRRPTFTIMVSLVFGGVFFLGALTAFIALQQLF